MASASVPFYAPCVAMLIGPKLANDATSGFQVKHTIQNWRLGIMTGSCHEAVASRASQGRSAKEESGRDQ